MPVVKFIPLPQKPHHTSMNCMLKTAMLSISLTTVLQLLPQLLPQLLMDVHPSPFALPLELTQPNALLKSLSVLHQEIPLSKNYIQSGNQLQLLPQLLMDVHQSPFALPLELTQPNALLKSLSVLQKEKPLMHQSSLSKTLLPNAQPLFQSALLPEKLQHHAQLPKKLALPPLCD
jgi:hypothetical protein